MIPKISIIIPCYNAENYIARCLNSVFSQSFKDFEAIVVNDGSTDNSLATLSGFKDDRLIIINKTNGGVSSARNAALEIAKGEWVTFVDIDDRLKFDALQRMIRVTDSKYDIVFAGFEIFQDCKLSNKIPALRGQVMDNICLARELFKPSDYEYLGYPWGKLFRRSIIKDNHIRFDESIIYNEDRLFTFTFLSFARGGFYTTCPVYEYYLHGLNAMSKIEGPDFWKFETDLDAFIKMYGIAKAFKSKKLVRLVGRGTKNSYLENCRLNAKYGAHSPDTRRRLLKKYRCGVSLWLRVYLRLEEIKWSISYRIYKLLK